MATKIRLDSQTQGKLPANSLYDWDENISWNKNFAWNTLYVDDTNDRIWIWTAAPRGWGKVDIVWWNLLIDWASIQWWSWGNTLEILRNALIDWGYKYIDDWYSAWIWVSQTAWYIWLRTAPSWAAWNTATFTEHMRLTNNGNVWIWTTSPNNSAKLDITSTTQGFLPPRMTTAQRDSISSPAGWLVIYNTTTKVLNFYNWTTWGAV